MSEMERACRFVVIYHHTEKFDFVYIFVLTLFGPVLLRFSKFGWRAAMLIDVVATFPVLCLLTLWSGTCDKNKTNKCKCMLPTVQPPPPFMLTIKESLFIYLQLPQDH